MCLRQITIDSICLLRSLYVDTLANSLAADRLHLFRIDFSQLHNEFSHLQIELSS